MLPLVVRLIHISDILALSLETRGFSAGKRPTALRRPGFSWRDWLALPCGLGPRGRDDLAAAAVKVSLQGLGVRYGNSGEWILQDIDLDFEPGSVVLLSGPCGSGKTTLLNCLNGVIPHLFGANTQRPDPIGVNGEATDQVRAGPDLPGWSARFYRIRRLRSSTRSTWPTRSPSVARTSAWTRRLIRGRIRSHGSATVSGSIPSRLDRPAVRRPETEAGHRLGPGHGSAPFVAGRAAGPSGPVRGRPCSWRLLFRDFRKAGRPDRGRGRTPARSPCCSTTLTGSILAGVGPGLTGLTCRFPRLGIPAFSLGETKAPLPGVGRAAPGTPFGGTGRGRSFVAGERTRSETKSIWPSRPGSGSTLIGSQRGRARRLCCGLPGRVGQKPTRGRIRPQRPGSGQGAWATFSRRRRGYQLVHGLGYVRGWRSARRLRPNGRPGRPVDSDLFGLCFLRPTATPNPCPRGRRDWSPSPPPLAPGPALVCLGRTDRGPGRPIPEPPAGPPWIGITIDRNRTGRWSRASHDVRCTAGPGRPLPLAGPEGRIRRRGRRPPELAEEYFRRLAIERPKWR